MPRNPPEHPDPGKNPTRVSPPPVPVLKGLIGCANFPLLYLNMPKAACTTIKNLLYFLDYQAFPEEPLGIHKSISAGQVLIGWHESVKLAAAYRDRRLCFTFVRHPVKRAYSCFIEKFFHQTEYSFRPLRNEVLVPKYGARFPESPADYPVELHADNFVRFLHMVADSLAPQSELKRNAHWVPQSDILLHARRKVEVDFIGRIERFTDDMQYILESVGAPDAEDLARQRFNEAPPAPYSYREVLNEEILERAGRIYQEDLVRFGYRLDEQ